MALLDNTVKVFFADTLKFFLSLYGHKLPVMSLDISSDSTLLISGSADKNIKIWGLDFGDCHRSLLAHEDSVMSVRREGARESRDARERERESKAHPDADCRCNLCLAHIASFRAVRTGSSSIGMPTGLSTS